MELQSKPNQQPVQIAHNVLLLIDLQSNVRRHSEALQSAASGDHAEHFADHHSQT